MYEYKLRSIERVVDGDTLIVHIDLGFYMTMREYVRLADVDTPEVYGRNAVEEGKGATEFTKQWIAAGKEFRIKSMKYDQREKYGRVLANVYRDSDPVSLSSALIAAGFTKT